MVKSNIAKHVAATSENVAANRADGKIVKDKRRYLPAKSPLRYPGGKTRGVQKIIELIPSSIDRLCSPFFGGGSLELACAARGIRVFGYDAFEPLVNFWNELLNNAPQLADEVTRSYFPLTRTKFYALQKRFPCLKNGLQRAAAFYALNRSSFSGTTLSGGMSPNHPRFTESGIKRLAEFKAGSLTIKHADFRDSIKKHQNDFLYLDPPYINGGKLYGERGDMHDNFDHAALAKIIKRRKGWLLSYNDCAAVRELYNGCQIFTPAWAYGMGNQKKSREILVLNVQ